MCASCSSISDGMGESNLPEMSEPEPKQPVTAEKPELLHEAA